MKLKQFAAASEPLTPRECDAVCDAARHAIGHPNDVASPCAMRHAPGAMCLAQTLTKGHAFAERQRRGATEAAVLDDIDC